MSTSTLNRRHLRSQGTPVVAGALFFRIRWEPGLVVRRCELATPFKFQSVHRVSVDPKILRLDAGWLDGTIAWRVSPGGREPCHGPWHAGSSRPDSAVLRALKLSRTNLVCPIGSPPVSGPTMLREAGTIPGTLF